MKRDLFKDALNSIDLHIWSSEPDVQKFMSALIQMNKCKNVLELGVFKGYTSINLMNAMQPNTKYVGIDVQDYRSKEVKEYMNAKGAEFILGNSVDVLQELPSNYFDFVFIDSDHTFEHLSKEFKECERIVTTNAIICIHDAWLEGLKKWIDYIKGFPSFEVLNLNTSEDRGLAIIKCLYCKENDK